MTDPIIPQRRCKKCGQTFDATPEFFHRCKSGKYGLRGDCKACHSQATIKLQQANPEHERAVSRAYYLANRERREEYRQAYRARNLDTIRQRGREWAKRNPLSPEQARIKQQKYRQRHPFTARAIGQRRRARIRKLIHDLTIQEWENCLAYFDYRCVYCGRKHNGLCQDHVVSVAAGGHYSADNIVPACPGCNTSKSSQALFDWLTGRYSFERAGAILVAIAEYFAGLEG